MQKFSHLLITFTLFLVLPAQQSFAQESLSALQQQVMDSHAARSKATIDEDIPTLSQYLAEELHYSHTRGNIDTKQSYLDTIASKKIDYLSTNPRDVEVRIYGDMAVSTGLSDYDLISSGEHLTFVIRFLEVSKRVGDIWQLVAWQSVRYTAGD